MTTTLYCPVPYSGVISQGYTITQAGTAVPDNLVGAIISAAYTAGVVLTTSAGGTPAVVQSTSWFNAGTGAPTSGSWSQGMEVRDSTGAEFVCTASGTPGTWVAIGTGTFVSAKSTVLDLVKDYGADPTGSTDCSAALDAAYADALASPAVEVTIRLKGGGTFLFSPASSRAAAILHPPNTTKTIVVRGVKSRATTVKLSANCPLFAGINTGPGLGVGYTFQNLHLEDFTVDNNSVTTTGAVILGFTGVGLNVDNLRVTRVDSINVGSLSFASIGRRNIDITSTVLTLSDPQLYTITNIRVEGCHWGRVGGGGNTGALVQGFFNGSGALTSAAAQTGSRKTNVYMNEIHYVDCKFESGATTATYTGRASAAASCGFQAGQDGWGDRLRIRNCVAIGSADDNIEVGNFSDILIEGCYTEDAMSEGVYIRPAISGWVDAYKQKIVVRDHVHRQNAVLASNWTSAVNGVLVHAKDYGVQCGHVVLENIVTWVNDPNALLGTGAMGVRVVGPFSRIKAKTLHTAIMGWTRTTAGNYKGVEIAMATGRGIVEVEDVTLTVSGTASHSSGTVSFSGLSLAYIGDYRVKIDGVHPRWQGVNKTGAGAVSLRDVQINDNTAGDTVDAFSSTTSLAYGYRADAGALSDLLNSGGVLTSAANHTTEKRLTWLHNQTDFTGGQTGPQSDGVMTVKVNPQTTPSTGFKAGVRLKVDSTGLNSLHGWLAFDGTNWTINVGTEQAGTVTTRTSATIGTTITSPAWVRLSQVGSLVTADYLTAVPATNGSTPAATNTAAYTVNTGDSTLVPFSAATQGHPGLVWAPQDATATLDDAHMWHRSTCTLTMSRVGAREVVTTGGPTALGVLVGTTLATFARVPKRYLIHDCDWSQYDTLGVTEFSGLSDAASLALVQRRDIRWVTPPASASITVSASPFTYTNQDGYAEDVAIYSGTVSSVTLQRNGQAAAGQIAAATGTVQRLEPGDVLVVTYSVAPTMRKVPVV